MTPIAASLGDLTTLYLLAVIARFFYGIHSTVPFLMPILIGVFILLIPIWAYVASKNEYVSDVLVSGWEPVIAAMVIRCIILRPKNYDYFFFYFNQNYKWALICEVFHYFSWNFILTFILITKKQVYIMILWFHAFWAC